MKNLIYILVMIPLMTLVENMRQHNNALEKSQGFTVNDISDDFENVTLYSESLILRNHKQKINLMRQNFSQFFSKLKYLDLGNNKFDKFENEIFSNLKYLRVLNISTNELVNIRSNIFEDLISLRFLNLSNNNLTKLPQEIFANNHNLRMLSLSGNHFDHLPEDLFVNNKNLTNVKIQSVHELTNLPNGLFSNLLRLSIVSISDCNLKSLPENLFSGSINLKEIRARVNALESLPLKIFEGLINLEILQLDTNRIESLPDNIFQSCANLRELHLDNNRIFKISRFTFEGLQQLSKLFMKNNTVTMIDEEALAPLKTVTYINFSHNNITHFAKAKTKNGVISALNGCSNLEELDLSFNRISTLFNNWTRISQIQYLNLSNNAISSLAINNLDLKHHQDFTLDISNNKIRRIDFNKCEEHVSEMSGRNITLIMNDNPLECDGSLYDLLRYFDGSMMKEVRDNLFIETGSMRCSNFREYENTLLSKMNSKDYKYIPSKEEIMNYELCPFSCDLWKRTSDQAFIIDCSYRNLTEIPKTLCFSRDKVFHNELDLTGNLIKNISALKPFSKTNLTNIYLSHNQITNIPKSLFCDFTLKVLKVDNNQLSSLPTDLIRRINLSRLNVTLGNNPYICDCRNDDLRIATRKLHNTIQDSDKIICKNSNLLLKTLKSEDICKTNTKIILTVSLSVGILGLIFASLTIFFCLYKKKIKVWLYTNNHCLWLVTEEEVDKDKPYDAFISYSHKDEEFVINELVTNLEKGPRSFKLCIHFRDWSAGELIPFQISKSIKSSRRTIVVVSPNFIASEWGKVEFRAAHKEALNEGRARIIVILYGDIGSIDKLEPDLKSYLRMNTYVQWGDPWFWDKLRYALPHKSDVQFDNRKLVSLTKKSEKDICLF